MSNETESVPSGSTCPKKRSPTFGGASRRLRWPSTELVADRSQGVQLATVQELARYRATDYHWRKAEAKLNALPQFNGFSGGDGKSGTTTELPMDRRR